MGGQRTLVDGSILRLISPKLKDGGGKVQTKLSNDVFIAFGSLWVRDGHNRDHGPRAQR